MCSLNEGPDFTEPRYDSDSYWGRVMNTMRRHNPLRIFACPSTLEEAKCLYLRYRCQQPLPSDVSEEELWRAQSLFESAYNPETGDSVTFVARPPMHIPMNAILAGGMMAFYQSPLGVVLWQWLNQTYNTLMAYTFRDRDVSDNQVTTSYALGTGTAIGTALALNSFLKCTPIGRFVPFVAVAAAHCISVPLMRAQMLKNGAPIYDAADSKLGNSKMAAQAGINGVVAHRILNALPPMILSPIIMQHLEYRGTLCRYPWLNFPGHAGIAFLCLMFLSPLTCALLSPRSLLSFRHLEPETQDVLCKKFYDRPPKYVYYDRGL